ncbi:MAG: M23 family metallopeptidase [Deltaproteobacteria bacterium]|nr:MAG: M23 family metallopeptidase [Deltaproteobacteria bacterium]
MPEQESLTTAMPQELRPRHRVGLLDTFGLRPLTKRLREAMMVFRGDPHVPPSKFGVSSLRILKPSISIPTWLGIRRKDKRVPLYNLFNHTQTPPEDGWSVLVTQVQDFRGGEMGYNSHNGTDFAIPVGTPVTTAAAGKVLLVSNEFNRGGLKIFMEHSHGLLTSYNHMSRCFVQAGDLVQRGQVIGLSGASGVENVLCFPWVAPHVHFNVWLNGDYVDPFARVGSDEESLWKAGSHPLPHQGPTLPIEEEYEPSPWDAEQVQAAIDSCKVDKLRQRLEDMDDISQQAMLIHMQGHYFPGRFSERPHLYSKTYPRTPWLDLPFRAEDFIGVTYPGFEG